MKERKKIRIVDTTLRDGMHSVSHQFSPQEMVKIAKVAEAAGIDTLEVTHGDGLGGASITYGQPHSSDQEYLTAVNSVLNNTKLAALLIPGIGTVEDLKMAQSCGIKTIRVATHLTEADISKQHITAAKKMGLEVLCFLMMAHMGSEETLLTQALLMQAYGAEGVYVVDSAGALTPDGVRSRVALLKNKLKIAVGFHAHNNLGLGIGNSIAAVEEGATLIDGSMAGLGAGAGNAQTEVLVAVLAKMGYVTDVDLMKIMDGANQVVRPLMKRPLEIDSNALTLGYAGVYSSFLLHAQKAAKQYDLDPRDILIELGKQNVVGGQEDWIFSTAYELSKQKKSKSL